VNSERNRFLSPARRIVIKIGSSLLTDEKKREIRTLFLKRLAEQVHALQQRGIQCLIVTSGAIAAGLYVMGKKERPKEIAQLQALAAVGQSDLMNAYKTMFKGFGLKVAQILLTREDLADRNRYSNAHHTVIELFRHHIVPVVNENDTVAVEEIKFGNNDTLGVLVAHLCEADLLILLTDTDGFFDEDPRLNPQAKLIPEVYHLDGGMEKNATKSKSMVGTGGMKTKIQAAKSMMQSGTPMIIANGNEKNVLLKIMGCETVGTFFHPSVQKMNSRKRWLAWSVRPKGDIVVDEGAKKALLEQGKSLLPTGVKMILGKWDQGDIVRIVDAGKQGIAKGIVNFSSMELDQIKGLKTSEIPFKLGRKTSDEVIHRDNMVKIDLTNSLIER
jgi:glutamate 5-kinase